MYRREAWAASILGRSKPDAKSTGPGPVTTAVVLVIGVIVGLMLLHFLGS
jgi:hypothetical protein